MRLAKSTGSNCEKKIYKKNIMWKCNLQKQFPIFSSLSMLAVLSFNKRINKCTTQETHANPAPKFHTSNISVQLLQQLKK